MATNLQIVRNKNDEAAILQQFGFLKDCNNEVDKKKVGCMICFIKFITVCGLVKDIVILMMEVLWHFSVIDNVT